MGRAGMKSRRGYSEGGRGWSEEWEGLEFKRGHAIQLASPAKHSRHSHQWGRKEAPGHVKEPSQHA